MDMPMMHMSFFFGRFKPFLFSTWSLETPGALFGAVVVVLLLAIIYELLKTCREALLVHDAKKKKQQQQVDVESQQENTPLLSVNSGITTTTGAKVKMFTKTMLKQFISPLHIVQSLLQVIQVGLGYLLMLAAMTFNGYLFLAVCLGAGIGYYLFAGFRHSVFSFQEQSDHCH